MKSVRIYKFGKGEATPSAVVAAVQENPNAADLRYVLTFGGELKELRVITDHGTFHPEDFVEVERPTAGVYDYQRQERIAALKRRWDAVGPEDGQA